MMGFDITFIPKLLLQTMYFHLSFLKESKQPIAENLSILKLSCVMIRCSDPGNSKPHGCNDGSYNRQDRKTSSWSPHWFPPSQVVVMVCVTQTNSRDISLLKRHCEWSGRVQIALTHFLWMRKQFHAVEAWTLKFLNDAAPLQVIVVLRDPFISRNPWCLHRSTKLGQSTFHSDSENLW